MGYKHDVLPAPGRKADQHQKPVRGDLVPGMGDGKETPETDGAHHFHKAGGTDVSCQVTWSSENDPEQHRRVQDHQDACQSVSLGQGRHKLVEKHFNLRMQHVTQERSCLAISEAGDRRYGQRHWIRLPGQRDVRSFGQQCSKTDYRTQRVDSIFKNRLTKSRSLEECRGVVARGKHECQAGMAEQWLG